MQLAPARARRALAMVALLAGSSPGQAEEILADLRGGRLPAALDRIERAGRIGPPQARLEIAELVEAAARASTDGDERERALRCAVRLLEPSVPGELGASRLELRYRAGVGLAEALLRHGPEPRDEAFVERLRALELAHQSLCMLDREGSRAFIDVNLALLPMRFAEGSFSLLNDRARELLKHDLTDAERADVRARYGLSLLHANRVGDAIPFLDDHLVRDPANPEHVHPVASRIPLEYADDAFRFLLPVVTRSAPRKGHETWTKCLERFYRNVGTWPQRREGPIFEFFAERGLEKPMPRVWPRAYWGEGYRVWLPDNAEPGKQYEGRHALSSVLPASSGWSKGGRLPDELARWHNHAYWYRHADGPILVVYWFGPHLDYWYGTTPVEKGVTGKTVRGFNLAGITNMVARHVYGTDARRRGVQFTRSRPFPFRPAVGSSNRRQWRVGRTAYDETFFSVGQVTVEILLRIEDDDLERLRPEIEWLYSVLRVR